LSFAVEKNLRSDKDRRFFLAAIFVVMGSVWLFTERAVAAQALLFPADIAMQARDMTMPNIPSGAELPRVFVDNQPVRPELVARPVPLIPPPPASPANAAPVGVEKRKLDRRQQDVPVLVERRKGDRRNRKRQSGEERRGQHISIKV
jgi:hypothetical protein